MRPKCCGKKSPPASLPAIACDWEITYLTRRINFSVALPTFAVWYFCESTPTRARTMILVAQRTLRIACLAAERLKVQLWTMLAQPVAPFAVVGASLSHQ